MQGQLYQNVHEFIHLKTFKCQVTYGLNFISYVYTIKIKHNLLILKCVI